MERFQDKAVKELRTYVTQTWNEEAEDRFPRLLLRLPPLRSLQPGLMEELFFAALIGTVHIDSVIPYILRMDSTEYNGQFGKKLILKPHLLYDVNNHEKTGILTREFFSHIRHLNCFFLWK